MLAQGPRPKAQGPRPKHFLFTAYFVALSIAGCDSSVAGVNVPSTLKGANVIPDGLLVPTSKIVDFGIVAQRGRKQAEIALTNRTSTALEVANIHTSCPCLVVQLARQQVGPSETVSAKIDLNFADEPDFVGHLRLEVEGRTPDGRLAVSVDVRVTVSPNRENP
jgi:hypothetical protein